ncbi:MAG: hypothetical protein ACRDN6_14985, partial [Gaiellaceae bacterium]
MPSGSTSCPSCAGDVPDGSSFCPHCGTRLAVDDTEVIPPPPDETGQVPVHVAPSPPHLFGVTPPLALFALGVSALAVGVLLLLIDHPVLGVALVVAGLLLLAGFLGAARRKPDTAVARMSVDAVDSVR